MSNVNPLITEELLVYLSETFPNKLPDDKDMTERELSYLVGQQSVIKHVAALYAQRNGNVMEEKQRIR